MRCRQKSDPLHDVNTATLFTTLGKAIAKGHSVRVTFGRIGVLVSEDHRVHFSFFSDDSDPTHPPQAQQHGQSSSGPAAQTSSVSTRPRTRFTVGVAVGLITFACVVGRCRCPRR